MYLQGISIQFCKAYSKYFYITKAQDYCICPCPMCFCEYSLGIFETRLLTQFFKREINSMSGVRSSTSYPRVLTTIHICQRTALTIGCCRFLGLVGHGSGVVYGILHQNTEF